MLAWPPKGALPAEVDVSPHYSHRVRIGQRELKADKLFVVNCGKDARGYVHGGINVGLGCSGDSVKYCLDKSLDMEKGNSDYVCNIF